jgi:hypothetical protein
MKSIIIVISYFGEWPKWFPLFLASCRSNPTINWLIITDCEIPYSIPGNVKFNRTTYTDYIESVCKHFDVEFRPADNYKICDLRPLYGHLYSDDIKGYDYYGFGDLDVIYGNIRNFYTDKVLTHNVISTHEYIISGHLALIKNEEWLRKSYLQFKNWKQLIAEPYNVRFDEDVYSLIFLNKNDPLYNTDPKYYAHNYFKEQYTTVFHPMPWHNGKTEHPDVWFWKDGVITNNRNLRKDYIYLHLMNFHSMRYVNPDCRKKHIPWKDNPAASFKGVSQLQNGVQIDWNGIHPI